MFAILVRNGKFLDNRYQWGLLPDLIPEWHFPAVMNVMMHERNPEKPTGFAIVNGKECIDLDNLQIIKIQEAHANTYCTYRNCNNIDFDT